MKSDNKISSRLSAFCSKSILVFSVLLLIFAVMPNFAQDSDQTGARQEESQLTRDELRDMLTEILNEGKPQANVLAEGTSETNSSPSYDQSVIEAWQQTRTNLLGEKLALLVRKIPDYPQDFAYAMGLSTSPDIGWGGFRVFATLLITVVIGLLAEQFTIRKLLNRLYLYVDSQEKTTALKYKFIVTRALIQLIGVAVLAIVAYAAAIYFRTDNPYFELLFNQTISALVMLRLWMILLRNIFSPNRSALRPIPLDDHSSGELHRWFIVFFFIIEFGNALFVYMTQAGMSEAQLNGFLIPYTLSLNLIILSRIWKMRKKITAMFIVNQEDSAQRNLAREFLYTAWPFVFTAWLLSLWMMWLYKAFLGSWEEASYISISWWITLAFFVADRIFYGLIKNVGNIDWLQSPTYPLRSSRFIKITLNGFRLLMIAVAVYMFSLAWGFTPGTIMQSSLTNKVLGQGINLLVIATITYIVWELFNALIERKLPKEADALATLEGEGGGAGATRAETLLPLMRTFLTVILVTFVVLSVLHSLGIAITPLLAGAGVVGIAIGFGAQKLVQDVLSGIFFLVDDAFRKSEYIEIENLRGTVEKISLRSMQLRHHLGAVQTIPYGEIKTVKNLSRDWITMKLELRLSYDTDIEQVRKIIKKVGQSMMEDPELGPSFILPLKSQGVMRVEESALIVRMKFTTKPGEQWVIRREAYRRVRDALADAGIYFAHREVRVRLPDDLGTSELGTKELGTKELGSKELGTKELPDKRGAIRETIAKAGGAAGAVDSQDAKKRDKVDFEDDM